VDGNLKRRILIDLEVSAPTSEDLEYQKTVYDKLIEEADGLFEAKNYQKSLSISFRARKILCGELEEETDQAAEVVPEEVEKAEKQGGEISECCLACGATVAEEDLFCGLCGSPVKERKCTSCGASLKSGDTFCRKCGARN